MMTVRTTTLSMIVRATATVVAMTAILGWGYPFVVTQVGKIALGQQAQGSWLEHRGRVVGSVLIGQDFSNKALFQSRPSATAQNPYNAIASGASNWAVNHPDTLRLQAELKAAWRARGLDVQNIPPELLMASASGLDPHISYEAACFQVPWLARETGLSETELVEIIDSNTTYAMFGAYRYVNVLLLNVMLTEALAHANHGKKAHVSSID